MVMYNLVNTYILENPRLTSALFWPLWRLWIYCICIGRYSRYLSYYIFFITYWTLLVRVKNVFGQPWGLENLLPGLSKTSKLVCKIYLMIFSTLYFDFEQSLWIQPKLTCSCYVSIKTENASRKWKNLIVLQCRMKNRTYSVRPNKIIMVFIVSTEFIWLW